MKTTANKISRVLGVPFLLQFITSLSNGSIIKPLWSEASEENPFLT